VYVKENTAAETTGAIVCWILFI